jgi:hypothetical protein
MVIVLDGRSLASTTIITTTIITTTISTTTMITTTIITSTSASPHPISTCILFTLSPIATPAPSLNTGAYTLLSQIKQQSYSHASISTCGIAGAGGGVPFSIASIFARSSCSQRSKRKEAYGKTKKKTNEKEENK